MMEVEPLVGLQETRSANMHDRGHAYYGTTCPDRHDLAAKWSARRLITPTAFLHAARHAPDLDGIADLLAVLPSDVCAYLAALTSEEWLIMQSLCGRGLRWKI